MNESSRRRWISLAMVLVLVLLSAGLTARAYRQDPEVVQARDLPPDDRRERWKQSGDETKQLTAEQRRALWRERYREGMRPGGRYFPPPPPQQQVAQVGQEITRTDPVRRPWGAGWSKGPPPRPGFPFGSRPPAPIDERERRRSACLEHTSPEDRAKSAEYLRQLEERRQLHTLSTLE